MKYNTYYSVSPKTNILASTIFEFLSHMRNMDRSLRL